MVSPPIRRWRVARRERLSQQGCRPSVRGVPAARPAVRCTGNPRPGSVGPGCAGYPIRHAMRRRGAHRWPARRRCAGWRPAAVRISRRAGSGWTAPDFACAASTTTAPLPVAGSLSSAISGRASVTTSEAMRPQLSVHATKASAAAVIGVRVVCHGALVVRVPKWLRCCVLRVRQARPDLPRPRSVANSVVADQVPTAPPNWSGVSTARRAARGRRRRRSASRPPWRRTWSARHAGSGYGPPWAWPDGWRQAPDSVETCSPSCALQVVYDVAHASIKRCRRRPGW